MRTAMDGQHGALAVRGVAQRPTAYGLRAAGAARGVAFRGGAVGAVVA